MISTFPIYRLLLLLGVLILATPRTLLANAIDAHEFATPELRDRYIKLVKEIRCPKCQNQNILDSNSQISIDLRNQVARLVKENKSDDEIKTYMVERYSEFVLYEPPLNTGTLLLWYGPFIMFGVGVLVFIFSVLKRRKNKLEGSEDDTIPTETSGAAK